VHGLGRGGVDTQRAEHLDDRVVRNRDIDPRCGLIGGGDTV
jgi:hypothetical protein